MKKINYWLVSSTAVALLAAAPFLASAHTGSEGSDKAQATINPILYMEGTGPFASDKGSEKSDADSVKAEKKTTVGLHVGQIFHWEGKDKDGDKDDATRTHATSTRPDVSGIRAGTITAINGSVLTIKPFGNKATTTVSTTASTVINANGQATSSTALTVGSKVFVAGTSTSDTNIAASFISIFTRGFGFFKHLFH